MKNIKNYILATLFVGAVFTGCGDLLELEPQASISDQIALSTPGNLQTAITGGYAALGGANAYGGSYIYLTDLYAVPASEVYFIGTFLQPREVNEKSILNTNSYIAGYWATSYNVINRANNVLGALDVFGNDAATRTRVEAEAKFLRGTAYFNLIQVFGRAYNDGDPNSNLGVPLVLTPTRVVDESLQVPRATVAQIYAQAISDLEAARDGLGVSNGFYANTNVASAMLARVHLAMGNFAAAGAQAQRVIASGRYTLFADITSNYTRTQNGTETIFAVQNTSSAFNNDMAVFYTQVNSFGRADIRVEDSHMTNYEADDARAGLFVNTTRGRMTTKFDNPDGLDSRRTNITVLRLAEMHLVRAEANFRITGSGAAGIGGVTPEDDINALRARVGLAPKATVSLAEILQERRNELMFEGVMLLDLKRTQGVTASSVVPSIAWSAPTLVFPVPQREMIVNSQLVQNSGYGN